MKLPIQMADWKVTRKQQKLVNQVLKSGRLTYGPMTKELENKFAGIHNREYGLFTNSGTSALKIVLHAMKDKYGWKDGDEVIIPAVTFVATMNAVLMNNLKPVLVDVEAETANINPNLIQTAITKKTRAIIPVHLLGQPAYMPSIMVVAKINKLKVIEDSCETMFVRDEVGAMVGSRGDAACFSSYIAHLMVTGVGGFILTNDEEMATTMRSIMFHGRDESYLQIDDNLKDGDEWEHMVKNRFNFPRHGYSDRATEMEAALGLGDLDNWENMIATRQFNAEYMRSKLQFLPVAFPWNKADHAFMFFPMYADKRDKLMMYLESWDIHTRTMMPLTTQPIAQKIFGKGLDEKYPMADYVNKYGLLLGCHQYLSKADLDYVTDKIREFYNE